MRFRGREHPIPGAKAFLGAGVCRPEKKVVEQSGVMEVTGRAVPAGVSHGGGGKGRACRPLAFCSTSRFESCMGAPA